MNRVKFIVLAMLAIALAIPGVAQEIKFQEKGWDKALKKAKKQDKLIFVDAYTTWCGPCKWMSANVFTDESVADFYNTNFINMKLDMEAGEGLEFAEKYGVRAYPTLLFVDGEGEVVHQRLGAVPAEMFLEFGSDALNPETRISYYVAEYESGNRDPEFLAEYVNKMVSAGMDPGDATDLYFAQLSTEQLATEENFMLIRMLRPGIDDPVFATVVDNHDAFVSAIGEEKVDDFIKGTCQTAALRAIYKDDEAVYASTIEQIESLNLPYEEEIILYANMRQSWGEGQYETYIGYASKYAKKYAWDDWNALNTIAWDIYEDTANSSEEYLDLGLKLAKRSVEIEENYYNTDTYAALLYRTAQYTEALTWADKAIELAKAESMDFVDTQKLRDKITAELSTN